MIKKTSPLVILCIALLILSIGLSFREQPAPVTINIKLTVPQAETVLKGLSKLPYEESAQIINEIQSQAAVQLNPPAKVDSTKHK